MDEFNAWVMLKIIGGMVVSAVLFLGVVYRTWVQPASTREKDHLLQVNELKQKVETIHNKTERHEDECEQRMRTLYGKIDKLQSEIKDLAIKTGKIESVVSRMEK